MPAREDVWEGTEGKGMESRAKESEGVEAKDLYMSHTHSALTTFYPGRQRLEEPRGVTNSEVVGPMSICAE
jgi:hypothetical protein